ncbi:nuclear transport factor 2 family protein [Solicola gregarius]|uniref:Nuclear transport factor 2 family protein n=1 Tax=Solicola gregarius TaxID=2908642 RepID=A0AA46TFI5_9ACTN|nr:nuclear transport factor 2 family protein [Solicola gregarius]UYM04248.1 nuclear transport factor 2 family protein [Solicola gregarius]
MNDLQAIADRAEIQALQAEFTDAAMMHDVDRLMSLYTTDAVYRIPEVDIELVGWEAIRSGNEQLAENWEFFVQNTHPGSIQVDGDTATGRALVFELGRQRDGRSVVNHALFHDRYRRTPDGWRFSERVYEVRYFDTNPLTGSPEVAWDTDYQPGEESAPAR